MVQHLNVPALTKQWVLDAQWTDCPTEVEAAVKHLWRRYELRNDHCMLRLSVNDLFEMAEVPEGETNPTEVTITVKQWFWGETDEEKKGWVKAPADLKPLTDYLRENGIPDDQQVIIHWWW